MPDIYGCVKNVDKPSSYPMKVRWSHRGPHIPIKSDSTCMYFQSTSWCLLAGTFCNFVHLLLTSKLFTTGLLMYQHLSITYYGLFTMEVQKSHWEQMKWIKSKAQAGALAQELALLKILSTFFFHQSCSQQIYELKLTKNYPFQGSFELQIAIQHKKLWQKAKAQAGALQHELVLFVILTNICLHQIFVPEVQGCTSNNQWSI